MLKAVGADEMTAAKEEEEEEAKQCSIIIYSQPGKKEERERVHRYNKEEGLIKV